MMEQKHRVVKLSTHAQTYIEDVVSAMAQQHQQTYGASIDVDATKKYCLAHVYCMLNENDILVGFFSVSRYDLAVKDVFSSLITLIFNLLFGRIYIYDVYVFPSYRRKGLGKIMMTLAIKEIQQVYWFINYVCLHSATTELIRFYETCGFQLEVIKDSVIYMLYTIF